MSEDLFQSHEGLWLPVPEALAVELTARAVSGMLRPGETRRQPKVLLLVQARLSVGSCPRGRHFRSSRIAALSGQDPEIVE